jgi:hypothetical protein
MTQWQNNLKVMLLMPKNRSKGLKLTGAGARRGIAEWRLVREAGGARVVEGPGIGAGGGFICKTYILNLY